MNNILALGNAACNIVNTLQQYKTYSIYKIQNEARKSKNTYIIPNLSSANIPNLSIANIQGPNAINVNLVLSIANIPKLSITNINY